MRRGSQNVGWGTSVVLALLAPACGSEPTGGAPIGSLPGEAGDARTIVDGPHASDAGSRDVSTDLVATPDDIDSGRDAGSPSQPDVQTIGAGYRHTCAILADGLATGVAHTCAILDDDTVKCWGQNEFGQLGLGDTQARGDGPNEMGANLPVVDLGPGRTARALTAGRSHTCAILDDDTAKCWGHNASGELGLGDVESRGGQAMQMGAQLPALNLGRTVKSISAGGRHTCAILDDDTAKCWGFESHGALGLAQARGLGDDPNEMGANLPNVSLR